MSSYTHDENTTVWWVPGASAVASIAAPTTVEIATGSNLSTFVPKDGIKLNPSNDAVSNDNITTAHKNEIPGAYGYKPVLTFRRDDSTDTAWTALKTRKTSGFLIIRRGVAFATAATAGQKCEVYPCTTGAPKPLDPSENERMKFDIEFFVSTTPNLDATIA